MEREKFVDESWKEAAELEKHKLANLEGGKSSQPSSQDKSSPQNPKNSDEASSDPSATPSETEAHFLNYVSSLAYQAMIFLGEIPHPATNAIEKNLEQSKFFIDILAMLREKTKGNLNKREADLLNTTIYELQMKFLEIAQKEGAV